MVTITWFVNGLKVISENEQDETLCENWTLFLSWSSVPLNTMKVYVGKRFSRDKTAWIDKFSP